MNIGAFEAVKIGIKRTTANWRLWLLAYVFNIIFAAVLTLPFISIFAKDIAGSLAGRDLLNGFNNRWFGDFLGVNGEFFKSLHRK